MASRRALVAAILLAACSKSKPTPHASGPAGTFDGTMAAGENPFTPADAIFVGALPLQLPTILVTDYANPCDQELGRRWVAGAHALQISVNGTPAGTSGTPEPFPPGTFPIGDADAGAPTAAVYDVPLDPSCNVPADLDTSAQSGTVTLDLDNDGGVTGTFDVTFAKGDHLKFVLVRATECVALTDHSPNAYAESCGAPVTCAPNDGGCK
jgi:hypothetical protein